MGYDVAWIAIAAIVGAVLQRSAGLGFALMLSPIAVAFLGPASGVMLVNLLAIASSLLILPSVWVNIDWRRLALLLAASVPGVLVGTWLTVVLDKAWLEITIGVMLMSGLIVTAFLPRGTQASEQPVLRLVTSGAAGVMSATAGAGGPAILIYASLARWPFPLLAATIQPYFASTAFLALISKLIAQPEAWPGLGVMEWVLVVGALAFGAGLAHILSRRIPTAVARIAAYAIASCGALAALVRGLIELVN